MGSAVVIGASIAGLCAAKALAARFTQVTVIERDTLPDAAQSRRSVPQGHHPHVLLAAGQRVLEELFPGLSAELADNGAVVFDPGLDLCVHRFGGVWPRVALDMRLLSFSRPLLDHLLHRRVAAEPNVVIRDGVAVSGLRGDDTRVTGVVLDDGQVLEADLVVDAGGRGSGSDRWLSALGCPPPETAEVKIGVGYASRFVRRVPDLLPEGKSMFVLPTPPAKQAGLVIPVEGDRWLVSMGGWHGDFPRVEEDFLSFAERLPHPAVHNVLKGAEPLGPFVAYGFPSSRRRYFEKLRRVPAGFVATGDALCSFNPIYGQGMTCAAADAVALGRMLDRHGEAHGAMVRGYYREVAKILKTPWRFAVGGDFAFPQTTGPRPRGINLLNGYSRRIQLASRTDPVVRKAFTSVQHLIAPPSTLFRPSIALRVWRAGRADRVASGAA